MNDTFYRLTTYNVLATIYVALTNSWGRPWVDIIRTTSLLIAVTIAITIIWTPTYMIIAFYKKTFPTMPSNLALIHLHNSIIHFLPVLLLGFPRDTLYIVVGFFIVYSYYLVMRHMRMLHRLYLDDVPFSVYDKMKVLSGLIVMLGLLLVNSGKKD